MIELSFSESEKDNLKSSGILGLILFGSQAQGVANDQSDFDFFIIGDKSNSNYDLLFDLLSAKINKLVNLDIVFDQDAPMELKNHVAKFGIPLFEANNNTFANFKQRVMIEYSDFAPFRKMFQDATLERIEP